MKYPFTFNATNQGVRLRVTIETEDKAYCVVGGQATTYGQFNGDRFLFPCLTEQANGKINAKWQRIRKG